MLATQNNKAGKAAVANFPQQDAGKARDQAAADFGVSGKTVDDAEHAQRWPIVLVSVRPAGESRYLPARLSARHSHGGIGSTPPHRPAPAARAVASVALIVGSDR